jgi:hypothetical protein
MTTTEKAPGQHPLAPPRGAAIAGVIFSVLMIVCLGLVRYAIPADLTEPGPWSVETDRRRAVGFALDLVPFAGIAFLWFVGVLRNRLGELEDQFFATVFLGSGLLFVASLFGVAAVMHALVETLVSGKIGGAIFYFGHRMSDALFNIFAIKMAGVFIISTCTIGSRTAIIPRWIAIIGYACAVVLLLVIANWKWIAFVFPLWMLLVSAHILFAEFRSGHASTSEAKQFQS